jgi:hypothetical protein
LRRRIFLDDFSFSKLATLHFQNLFVFGKLLQQATHLGDGKLRKITPKKMLCQDMALSQHHVSSTHPGREKRNSTVTFLVVF